MTAKTSANDWSTRKAREAARSGHDGRCDICGATGKTRGLQWDHDHKTGAHRGWLCHRCNRALPSWVTPKWLAQAAWYLMRPRSEEMRASGAGYAAYVTWEQVWRSTYVNPSSRAVRNEALRARAYRRWDQV